MVDTCVRERHPDTGVELFGKTFKYPFFLQALWVR